MCSRCDSINDAINYKHEVEDYLTKLSNEEYAALDLYEQIKAVELTLLLKTQELERLKKTFGNRPIPVVPIKYQFNTHHFSNTSWRWRGKRDIQNKLYGWE